MIESRILGPPRAVIIDYIDGEAAETTREIVPARLAGEMRDGVLFVRYVHAHCRKARAIRSFRLDRIRSVADARTGELLDRDAWLAAMDLDPIDIGDTGAAPAPTPAPAPAPPTIITAPGRAGVSYGWLIVMVMIGYMVGRYKLLSVLGAAFGWRALRGW